MSATSVRGAEPARDLPRGDAAAPLRPEVREPPAKSLRERHAAAPLVGRAAPHCGGWAVSVPVGRTLSVHGGCLPARRGGGDQRQCFRASERGRLCTTISRCTAGRCSFAWTTARFGSPSRRRGHGCRTPACKSIAEGRLSPAARGSELRPQRARLRAARVRPRVAAARERHRVPVAGRQGAARPQRGAAERGGSGAADHRVGRQARRPTRHRAWMPTRWWSRPRRHSTGRCSISPTRPSVRRRRHRDRRGAPAGRKLPGDRHSRVRARLESRCLGGSGLQGRPARAHASR